MPQIILTLGVLYFLAHAFTAIFERTRIPDILLLIFFGIVVGPLTGLVSLDDFGKVGPVLSTLTLIVILFESGTGLSLKVLRQSIGATAGLSLATFTATFLIVIIFGRAVFDISLLEASILGAILAGTSSAVVIPMAKALKLDAKSETVLVLESALTDVLCIVLVFALLGASSAGIENFSAPKVLGGILSSLILASLIGLLGSIGWTVILNKIRSFPNTILTTLAFSLIVYGVAESIGVSGAIAALIFGLGLQNHGEMGIDRLKWFKNIKMEFLNETEQSVFREIVFALKTFFFIYLGISMNLSDISLFKWVFLMIAAIYMARLIITRFTCESSTDRRDLSHISVMVPKGLAAAVLGSLPAEQGLPYGEVIKQVTFMTVLGSILLTAVLVPLIEARTLNFFYARIFLSRKS